MHSSKFGWAPTFSKEWGTQHNLMHTPPPRSGGGGICLHPLPRREAPSPRGVQGAQPPGNFGTVTDKNARFPCGFHSKRNPSPKIMVSDWAILSQPHVIFLFSAGGMSLAGSSQIQRFSTILTKSVDLSTTESFSHPKSNVGSPVTGQIPTRGALDRAPWQVIAALPTGGRRLSPRPFSTSRATRAARTKYAPRARFDTLWSHQLPRSP